jgi:hypothetical protein
LLTLEATGDYAGAKKMLDALAVMRPDVSATIAKLGNVPVDINITYATADELAPAGKLSDPRHR